MAIDPYSNEAERANSDQGTFTVISNWKIFGLQGSTKMIQRCKGSNMFIVRSVLVTYWTLPDRNLPPNSMISKESQKRPLYAWLYCNIVFMHILKHTTTLLSLSDHEIPSQEWRVPVQINYHGGPMVLWSIRRDRAVDYEGSSLWSDMF